MTDTPPGPSDDPNAAAPTKTSSESDTSTTRGVGHPSGFPVPPHGHHRGRWVVLVSVIGGVGLLTSLFAFGLSRDPAVIRSPLLGHQAPDFALPTLDGSSVVRLSALRGQVVVLNFWASWCAACRVEHPNLVAAWDRYRDQGVVLVGIDFQDQKQAVLDFMREMGGDWPVVEDPGERTALDYGVYGVPETFFIGREGVVRYKRVGPVSYELLTEEIQRLLDRAS